MFETGADATPTISESATTTETVSMESNAPAAPENSGESSTTIPNPLAQGDQASDQVEGSSDQVTDQVSDQATDQAESPKDLKDVMFNSIGEKAPDPEDLRSDFEKIIPDEYKDKPWIKKYSSVEQVLKAHDGALSKLSERPEEIDYPNATEEQINGVYDRMRPEDKSAYEFPETASELEKDLFGDLFHKAGMHPHKAKELVAGFNEAMTNIHADAYSNESFEKNMAVAVGADFSAKMPDLQKSIADAMGQEVVQYIDKLPSNFRAAFYGFANRMNESYGAGEASVNAASNDFGSVNWESQKTDALNKIRAMESNPNHKQADIDHEKARYKEAIININKMKGSK